MRSVEAQHFVQNWIDEKEVHRMPPNVLVLFLISPYEKWRNRGSQSDKSPILLIRFTSAVIALYLAAHLAQGGEHETVTAYM